MAIDDTTRKEIENKAKLLEGRKEQAKEFINYEIDSIIKRLRTVEDELINEVDFYTNTYAELLASIDTGNCPSDDEIKSILSKEVPSDFGPGISSFNSLREEIESLRLWREKKEKKSKLNPFDLTPKNIKITSTAYDSVSICWDKVDCDCYYEVELESSLTQKIYQTQKTEYTFTWLDSGTEYKFRVRAVPLEKDAKNIWSDPIIVRTTLKPYNGVWKKCPEYVDYKMKYSVDENNHRIATKINDGSGNCTIIGNTSLPLNKITSWNIKILNSQNNDGYNIFIGVAPFDINQNQDNYKECGWYFGCYWSMLYSGPPHKYYRKEYGPMKGDGKYVHTGDSVGIVMDTTNGKLSFILSGSNYGVAYEGIPLDKPLVPCVVLYFGGNSVELVI